MVTLDFPLNLLHTKVALQQEIILQLSKSVLILVSLETILNIDMLKDIQYTALSEFVLRLRVLFLIVRVDTCA